MKRRRAATYQSVTSVVLQKEVLASPNSRIQRVVGTVHTSYAPRSVVLLRLTDAYPVDGSLELAQRIRIQKYLKGHEIILRDAIYCHWRTRPHQVRRDEAVFTRRFPYLNGFSI